MAERTWPVLVAEAVGTFLFFFVGAGAIVVSTIAGPNGPGLVGIALAHGLVLAVLVSALAAVGSGHFNTADSFGVWVAGIAIEAVLTVIVVLVVFGTAVDDRAPQLGGLAIGLAVAADILMGGPLTGAAMNPARWFGPAVASGALDNWYVWWIGPLVGAGIAGLLYRYAFAGPGPEVAHTHGATIGLEEEAEGSLQAPEGVRQHEHTHEHDEDAGHHGHDPMSPP